MGAKSTATTGKKALTVLIADDSPSSRRSVRGHLEVLGYRVVGEAADGLEAVELFERLKPDLVILDIVMPGMTGIEAARAISSKAPVPIILVTGHSTDKLTAEAVEAGVFGYLVKPVAKKQLLPAVKLALARYEEFNSLRKEVKDLKEAVEARKLIERAKGILMKRCDIGEEEAFKLLQSHSQKENKKMRDIAAMIIEASRLI